MKITKSVSSTTKPHNLTPQATLTSGFGSLTPEALNLRNPMQAERSDVQPGVVTSPLTATPVGVEPTSGFSGWGTPVLRVSPAVTQIERLRRSATPLRTLTPEVGVRFRYPHGLTSKVGVAVRQPRVLTPQALNLRNPMQAERSDAQLGVVTSSPTTTPAGVEPPLGFSEWGTPVLRVSPAVTQIERLRRSATPLRTSVTRLRRSGMPLRILVVRLRRSATPDWSYSDISNSYYSNHL